MEPDLGLPLLQRVITEQQPFGPPDAAQFTASTDLLRLLYDPANRIHRQAEMTGAPYVIGRKGAGKTAFVMAPKLRDEVVAVELPSADVYQGVFGVVTALFARERQIFAEHTARLWRHLTWSAVLCAIARGPKLRTVSFRTVREYAESLGDGVVPADAGAAVSGYLRRVRATIDASGQLGGLGDILESVRGNGRAISEAIDAGTKLLADSPSRYVVIVDSLEHYTGDLPTNDYQQVEQLSFEGLFRFIGGDGTMPLRSFDIRFAFPAEMWTVLEKVSANPIKDFHSRVVAHWSARELIGLTGTRLALYCHLHHPTLIDELELDDPLRALSYNECRRLIDAVLPAEVVNAYGGREDAVAYLLRHTQLLPRHLITILNRVFEAQSTIDRRAPFPVSKLAVVEGVRRGETEIVRDVIASYSRVHPDARLCCERIIPNVGQVLESGELHRAFNQTGIRKATGLDYRDVQRMLIEIGCLGRIVEAESTSRYVVGEFEYTRSGSLHVGAGEPVCLHPVFAEVYSCRHSASRRTQLATDERQRVRPIYPVGTDPNAPFDYRDAM
jgi:hypothetical protein